MMIVRAIKFTIRILTILIIFVLVSCSNDSQCRKTRYVKLQLGLYHVSYSSLLNETTVSILKVDSITVKGIGVDSLLYDNTKGVQSLTLPINKLANETDFQVTFNQVTDTIRVLHENIDTYLSLECGCIKTHKIDTVITTNHFIDSVKVSVHDINTTTSVKEQIKLYN